MKNWADQWKGSCSPYVLYIRAHGVQRAIWLMASSCFHWGSDWILGLCTNLGLLALPQTPLFDDGASPGLDRHGG